MTTRTTMRSAMAIGTLLVGAVLEACGGGGGGGGAGGGGGGDVATTAGGEAITTASGQEVNVVAHEHWSTGLTAFGRYETEGWNPGRCSEVEEHFDEAISAQGGHFAEAQYMIGLTAARCGDASGARRGYDRALESNPKLCNARVAIGMIQIDAGQTDQGRRTFEQAVRDDHQCTTAYVNIAVLQMQTGNTRDENEALLNLRRALAIDSNYLPAFNQMALLHYRQAQRRGGQAAMDLAELVCRQAQLINANYAPIYNTWGLVKMLRGDVIEALKFFERAIQLDSNLFEAQMNFGQITQSFRGYQDAQRAFARAVELRSDDYEAVIGLGAAHRGLAQYDQARAQYERAIQIAGNRPEAYFNLGILYQDYLGADIPSLERAKGYLRQFLDRAGERPQYAETVQNITRRCREPRQPSGRRRRIIPPSTCKKGRLQIIDDIIAAIREGEQMQREAEALQREAEQMERDAAQQPAPAPEGGQ